MQIINNSHTQLNLQKEITTDVVKKDNISNGISENDSFAKQEIEEKPSFWNKVKDKALASLSKPFYSNYPEITEEKKQKIMDSLESGDIILATNANYPTWLAMEKLLGDSDYSHAAIYEGDGYMLESASDYNIGVTRTDLNDYLHGRMAVKIIRPDYKSLDDVIDTLDYARERVGTTPFDTSFDYSEDDKLYCSELVAKALKSMPSQMYVPTQTILGREAILPGDFDKLENSKIVYDDKYSLATGLKTMAPALAGGVAMAVGAGVLLGPVGAVIGLIGGTLATSLIGGKKQVEQLYGEI